MKQLSKDRWAIYNATQNGLTDQTERLWKNKYISPYDREHNSDEKTAGIRHAVVTKSGTYFPPN